MIELERKTAFLRLVLLSTLLLAGCAGTAHFREGGALHEQGRDEEALPQYREALRAEPTNAQYREAYLRARDALVQDWLTKADKARRTGVAQEAETLYQRVLQINENEPRALDGLLNLKRDGRHVQYLEEARAEIQQGDSEAALGRLRIVLTENPKNAAALAMRHDIESKRLQPQSSLEAKLAEGFRKPVSIEFRDAQLREVFEVLSRASGLNFVLDKDIKGDARTTIFLRSSTVADALKLILLTNQLDQRVLDATSVLIYPNTPAKARDYQALSVKTLTFNNADAKAVANTLRTILKSKNVVVLERQNAIIMRDTPDAIRLAERIAAVEDRPDAEVMLDVEVLEVQRSRLLNLGVEYPPQISLTPLATAKGASLTVDDLRHLNGTRIGATLGDVTIAATHNVGDIRLLANPRIRTLNHEKAQVMVGERVPTVTTTTTATGFSANSVNYLDVGLKLNVEPTISGDGEVTIRMTLEVSSIVSTSKLADGTTTYELGTRSANTTLRLHDGENQVLAGLINDRQNTNSARIPGLGDIPLLGRLFGSNSDSTDQSEIVLSITPRIVRPIRRLDAEAAEFDSGTENSLYSASASVEVASSPSPMPPSQPIEPPVPVMAPVVPPDMVIPPGKEMRSATRVAP